MLPMNSSSVLNSGGALKLLQAHNQQYVMCVEWCVRLKLIY